MDTAIEHHVPDRVKLSIVIFDIRTLWASKCPDVKNYKWRLNPVWQRMLGCTRMATMGRVKGLIGSYLPASIMVLVNSSRRMLRTWRAPASPCACAQTTFTVAKRLCRCGLGWTYITWKMVFVRVTDCCEEKLWCMWLCMWLVYEM